MARGEPQAALTEIAQEPLESLRNFIDALAYHALGRRAEADSILNDMIAGTADREPTRIAEILAFRGDTDRAFEFLGKAVAAGDLDVLTIKSDYFFRHLHDDPRYRAILQRLSLPEGEK